jgi:Flp pilus assembly protein TadD
MKNAVAVLDENTAVLKKAAEFLEIANFEKAINVLEKHLLISSDDIEAIHLLGTAFARSGDFLKAEETFRKELNLSQTRPDAHFNLGIILVQQNRLSEAA